MSFSTVCTAQKADFDPNAGVRNVGVVPTTPIDKMMVITQIIGRRDANWGSVAQRYKNYMEVDLYSDKSVKLPILIGMRMSDGALSIMAENVKVLNNSVSDIELMASELGVGEGQLKRTTRVKSFANRGKWNRVFLELGFLQKDIIDTMVKEGNKDRRSVLIAAAWIQSTEMISWVILDNYSDDTSEVLREPDLVSQMIKDLETINPEKRDDPLIVEMLFTLNKLQKLIDVPLHSEISKDKVKEIHNLTSGYTKYVMTSENKPSSFHTKNIGSKPSPIKTSDQDYKTSVFELTWGKMAMLTCLIALLALIALLGFGNRKKRWSMLIDKI